ncbi:hypothetical protein NIES2100_34970 [Calothrix sp. NIES-2100]|uniref:hypothetical protein n=1 Tax=Calothrix sp. NIES-2100 TaxID=1954172 RepID=UPI000B5EEF24|nr:hypothetical protein NIES2100_34970 [Calothrix sp. NIES-2100]
MPQILGTILDSGDTPITGKLRVTLSGTMTDISPDPDSINVVEPKLFTITNGVVDITLRESETKKITYRFEFFKTDGDGELIEPALLDFYALVPNATPIQFGTLVPTGMVNDVLDTGCLRIAQIIANDPSLSANIGGPFPRGDFNSLTTYKYRDLVNYLNRVYICRSTSPIVGILPTNSAYWQLLPIEPDGNLILGSAEPYGSSWNGSGLATSQNAVYTKIESVSSDLNLKANVNSPSFNGVANFNNTLRVRPPNTNDPGAAFAGLDIQTANGYRSVVRFSNNTGSKRWEVLKSEESESGSNAGSNFVINSYDDSGNYIGWCMTINRASRGVNVVTPSAGDNSSRIANTSWVRALTSALAPLASPEFTGAPKSTTPSDPFDNTTRVATCQHVQNILSFYAKNTSPTFYGIPVFSGGATFNQTANFKTIIANSGDVYNPGLDIRANSNSRSCVRFSNSSGLTRWEFFKSQDAESGSNVGSDFAITRHDDAGNYLDYSLSIARNTGKITLNSNTSVNGNLNCNSFTTNLVADFASSATGNLGDIKISPNYWYVCVSTNTWRRVALSAF